MTASIRPVCMVNSMERGQVELKCEGVECGSEVGCL